MKKAPVSLQETEGEIPSAVPPHFAHPEERASGYKHILYAVTGAPGFPTPLCGFPIAAPEGNSDRVALPPRTSRRLSERTARDPTGSPSSQGHNTTKPVCPSIRCTVKKQFPLLFRQRGLYFLAIFMYDLMKKRVICDKED